ncbi:MAG: hypothetical protein A2287_02875 [Candidatus Melainabacteria bacterium RIFOXYA12_FULL_32_12]|nr:MAG: hypothetical protein A2104_08390 [Candidatus Melainabacteria bacterium GWF2_32_7]OGI22724.1 MAG: hypothetical protein A2255_08320 [Candidatus Melainabacteria bacterium RIFOXYA2_FULL_32_9]OGI29327.1 MAG: hypothetical protein A2287_02875 [Candidatus Melainabacteria bacterium RIFOXYA12_FULL_32_12]
MKNKPADELKSSIVKLSGQIDQLKSRITTCDDSNRVYNRLIIERACIRQKLKEMQSKNIVSFFCCKKVKSKGNQKRICDYFSS